MEVSLNERTHGQRDAGRGAGDLVVINVEDFRNDPHQICVGVLPRGGKALAQNIIGVRQIGLVA